MASPRLPRPRDAGQGLDAGGELVGEGEYLVGLRIANRGKLQTERLDLPDGQTGIHAGLCLEAARHEAGSHQQDQGQGDFAYDEEVMSSQTTDTATGYGLGALAKRLGDVDARAAERRHEP